MVEVSFTPRQVHRSYRSRRGRTRRCPPYGVVSEPQGHEGGLRELPFDRESFDFVFSLGVVHHLPDTPAAVREAASMLKPGGWLLLYVYYNLDNRGALHRVLFGAADGCRRLISRLPRALKFLVCEAIAVCVYAPFVLFARFVKPFDEDAAKRIPLRVLRRQTLEGHSQRFARPLRDAAGEAVFASGDQQMLVAAGMAGHSLFRARTVLACRRPEA